MTELEIEKLKRDLLVQKLHNEFSGANEMIIQNTSQGAKRQRNEVIYGRHLRGDLHEVIGGDYGLTEYQIDNIVKGEKKRLK